MQNFDHNIGFGEKRHFFAENCRKSQNIVIITSVPVLLRFDQRDQIGRNFPIWWTIIQDYLKGLPKFDTILEKKQITVGEKNLFKQGSILGDF
jgi:hypothetical protein